MNISKIRWPIFAIGTDHDTFEEMNVTYVNHSGMVSILDNKNLSGDTLGKRRLRVSSDRLYKLKRTLFMFSELIEYTRTKLISDRKFVDSNGIVFNYLKKYNKKLIWREIRSVETFDSYVILKVNGLTESFELPNNYWNKFKNEEKVYLGLLYLGKYYSIYDIDIVLRKDTWRKL